MAFCDPALCDRILGQLLRQYTQATDYDPAAVQARLAQIRSRGIAESSATYEAEVQSLAAPLFDATGQSVGALAVAAPSSRVSSALRDRIIAELTPHASEIVALWGGTLPNGLAKLWTRAD